MSVSPRASVPTVSVLTTPEGMNARVALGSNPVPICDTVWVSTSETFQFNLTCFCWLKARNRNETKLGTNEELRKNSDRCRSNWTLFFIFFFISLC